MAQEDDDEKAAARKRFVELMGGEERIRELNRRGEELHQMMPKDLDPDDAFAYAVAIQTASMALTQAKEDMGEDGADERFDVFQHFVRAMPTDEQYEYGASRLDMPVDRFRERVAFLNERVVARFRELVALTEAPQYVDEETEYLLGLVDRGGKPPS